MTQKELSPGPLAGGTEARKIDRVGSGSVPNYTPTARRRVAETDRVQVPPAWAMNRRERRKWRAGVRTMHRRAAGIMEVVTIPAADILGHPESRNFLKGLARWMRQIPTARPLCMTCNICWTTIEQRPTPAAFTFTRPYQQAGPQTWLVSAVCQECAQRSDLSGRVTTALKKMWPDLRVLDKPHDAPRARQ